VTDAGLGHLRGLVRLEELNLSEDRVTAQGLESLRGLANLQKVYLHQTDVDDETVQRFLEGDNPIHLVTGRREKAAPHPAHEPEERAEAGREEPAGDRADAHGDPLPPGARARLGTRQFWQESEASCLALSPDGRLVASGDEGGKVRLWDAATGRLVRVLPGKPARLTSLAFSPDGGRLAAGGDDRACLWDVATGRAVRDFSGSWFGVHALAFAPDGKALALALFPSDVRVLDLATGKQVLELHGERDRRQPYFGGDHFTGLAFAPDGKALAAGGRCQTSTPTHKTIAGQERPVLLTSETGRVWVWDYPSGKPRYKLGGDLKMVHGLAFGPGGRTLVTADGRPPRVWDAATGKPVRRIEVSGMPGSTESLAVGPDGRGFAVADGRVRGWDLASGKVDNPFDSWVAGLALSGDGRTLATRDGHGFLAVWDPATGKERLPRAGHRGAQVHDVAVSPDGKTVATAGDDHTVRLWEAATGREIRVLETGGLDVDRVRFAPDGRRLAAAVTDRRHTAPGRPAVARVLVWGLADGKKVLETADAGWAGTAADDLALGPGGTLVVGRNVWEFGRGGQMVCKASAVVVLDASTGKVLRELPGRGQPARALALSHDERVLAWGGDAVVRVVRLATGEEVRTFPIPGGNNSPVRSVAFSPDGKLLAAGAEGGAVAAWDVGAGRQVHAFRCPDRPAHVALQFVASGRLLAAADAGRRSEDEEGTEVCAWDVASGRRLAGPFRAGVSATALALSPDGVFLAAGYYSPAALLWDLPGAGR
jgi:WD40 repeat protein